MYLYVPVTHLYDLYKKKGAAKNNYSSSMFVPIAQISVT